MAGTTELYYSTWCLAAVFLPASLWTRHTMPATEGFGRPRYTFGYTFFHTEKKTAQTPPRSRASCSRVSLYRDNEICCEAIDTRCQLSACLLIQRAFNTYSDSLTESVSLLTIVLLISCRLGFLWNSLKLVRQTLWMNVLKCLISDLYLASFWIVNKIFWPRF